MRKLRTAVFNKLVGNRTNKFLFMAASVGGLFLFSWVCSCARYAKLKGR
jgi:hypothetical protein